MDSLFFLYRCPYYVSRELHKTVDILFAPYNYLIDRGYRKSLNIQWTNSILIFDEAHNLVNCTFSCHASIFLECSPLCHASIVIKDSILIYLMVFHFDQESLCADAASFDLSSGLLTACISEAKSCIDLSIARRENSSDKSCNPDNFAILRGKSLIFE